MALIYIFHKNYFSLQTIAIGWIFGVKKFANCVEQMTGFKPNLYWTLTWGVIAPLVMAVIFLFYCFRWEPVKYGTVEYPPWAHTIGFFMSLSSMVWIPGYAVYWMCTTRGSIKDVSFRAAGSSIFLWRRLIKATSTTALSQTSTISLQIQLLLKVLK